MSYLPRPNHSIFLFTVVDLQIVTFDLDKRVTTLEENGGGGGNSSVAELEVRVETLEGTAADQEIRLTAVEENIQGGAHHHELIKIANN